jgi:cobalt transporter subunit CbtA
MIQSAVLAGFAAGIIAAILHLAFVQPILLEAELYESGAIAHGQGIDATETAAAEMDGHKHDHVGDVIRNTLSLLFLCCIYVAYALLMVTCFSIAEFFNRPVEKRAGLIWGICGFAAMQLFPAFGLPPELPGNSSPGLEIRQLWWGLTAFATVIGFGAIFWNKSWIVKCVGLAIISLPHLIGAPSVSEFAGVAPPELSSHFASRSLALGFIVWSFLGVFLTYFWLKQPKSE